MAGGRDLVGRSLKCLMLVSARPNMTKLPGLRNKGVRGQFLCGLGWVSPCNKWVVLGLHKWVLHINGLGWVWVTF